MRNAPDVKYARNGEISLAYSIWGEGKEAVVFTPPLISNVELVWELPEWNRVLDWAGKHVRTLMMDKRGVGLSDRTAESMTLDDYVSDVLAVMDAEKLEAANIVGLSEGAVIGLALAASRPERVRKLSLVGAPAIGFSRELIERHLSAGEQLPTEAQASEHWRELIRTWGTDESNWLDLFAPVASKDERIRRWWARFERQSCSPGTLLRMLQSLNRFDVSPLLHKVRSPTLVCHSRGDLVNHVAEGRTIAAGLPDAKYLEWDNSNHLWGFSPTWREHLNDLIEFNTGTRPGSATRDAFATILLTDIVGSTKLASQLGDKQWQAKLELHDTICRACLSKWEGDLVKHTGDGILATFASPVQAATAALEMLSELKGTGVSIRAGIHGGQIQIHDDGDISGIAVNLASRVQSLATHEELLVSQTVKDMLMGTSFEMADKGEHSLKGIEGSWRIFSVSTH